MAQHTLQPIYFILPFAQQNTNRNVAIKRKLFACLGVSLQHTDLSVNETETQSCLMRSAVEMVTRLLKVLSEVKKFDKYQQIISLESGET